MKHNIDDLIEKISQEIHSTGLAVVGKLKGANRYGVKVFWNKKDVGKIMLVFITHDDIQCNMTIDLPSVKTSRQLAHYLQNGFMKVMEGIEAKRIERSLKMPEHIRPLVLPAAIKQVTH